MPAVTASPATITVRVQTEPFDLAEETRRLTHPVGKPRTDIGALATFTGLVRGGAQSDDPRGGAQSDDPRGEAVDAITLEHYPAMTEKALAGIARQAQARWPILAGTIIHRVGRLAAGDPIVLVAVAAAHRGDAFAAAEFLMDWLKTRAPFWKKEDQAGTPRWVEARAEDAAAADRWKE